MDNRIDRLYALLPRIVQRRDLEQGQPLRALLQVIAEQANVIEDDIAQLYENWFIETCQDWVVPYIGDLIDFQPVHSAGDPGPVTTREGRALDRILIPRTEVANTIHNRRRRGTLTVLESLALDVAGWPAHAVEFYRLLAVLQHLDHRNLNRGRTVDLRAMTALERLDSPFERLAHTVDVRSIGDDGHRQSALALSLRTGLFNIPNVGLYVWRLKSYTVSGTPPLLPDKPIRATRAFNMDADGHPSGYTFHPLGFDTRLFTLPQPPADDRIVTELQVPAPITRRMLQKRPLTTEAALRQTPPGQASEDYYSADKSLAVWIDGWPGTTHTQPVPASDVIPADLSNWAYRPPPGKIAIDPELGRIAVPNRFTAKPIYVRYTYGFSADMGGGEYTRTLLRSSQRTPTQDITVYNTAPHAYTMVYQVGEQAQYPTFNATIAQFTADKPEDAVIEITDSHVYSAQFALTLHEGQSLQIRAANGKRPVLRLLDTMTDDTEAALITGAVKSRLLLDGLTLTNRYLKLTGAFAEARIRHCTLLPGWELDCDCKPRYSEMPSLTLADVSGCVHVEHTITGSILVTQEEPQEEAVCITIADSILDATTVESEAFSAEDGAIAAAVLNILRSTVIGGVHTHQIPLAENCIFMSPVTVARRQTGCIRFCYLDTCLPEDDSAAEPRVCSRTPRRYECQPDLVEAVVLQNQDGTLDKDALAAQLLSERRRVRPVFNSLRYGASTYCQLADTCAAEIVRGADDEAEMGAFHDLFQPQRVANLLNRLEDFTPAGSNAGILIAT